MSESLRINTDDIMKDMLNVDCDDESPSNETLFLPKLSPQSPIMMFESPTSEKDGSGTAKNVDKNSTNFNKEYGNSTSDQSHEKSPDQRRYNHLDTGFESNNFNDKSPLLGSQKHHHRSGQNGAPPHYPHPLHHYPPHYPTPHQNQHTGYPHHPHSNQHHQRGPGPHPHPYNGHSHHYHNPQYGHCPPFSHGHHPNSGRYHPPLHPPSSYGGAPHENNLSRQFKHPAHTIQHHLNDGHNRTVSSSSSRSFSGSTNSAYSKNSNNKKRTICGIDDNKGTISPIASFDSNQNDHHLPNSYAMRRTGSNTSQTTCSTSTVNTAGMMENRRPYSATSSPHRRPNPFPGQHRRTYSNSSASSLSAGDYSVNSESQSKRRRHKKSSSPLSDSYSSTFSSMNKPSHVRTESQYDIIPATSSLSFDTFNNLNMDDNSVTSHPKRSQSVPSSSDDGKDVQNLFKLSTDVSSSPIQSSKDLDATPMAKNTREGSNSRKEICESRNENSESAREGSLSGALFEFDLKKDSSDDEKRDEPNIFSTIEVLPELSPSSQGTTERSKQEKKMRNKPHISISILSPEEEKEQDEGLRNQCLTPFSFRSNGDSPTFGGAGFESLAPQLSWGAEPLTEIVDWDEATLSNNHSPTEQQQTRKKQGQEQKSGNGGSHSPASFWDDAGPGRSREEFGSITLALSCSPSTPSPTERDGPPSPPPPNMFNSTFQQDQTNEPFERERKAKSVNSPMPFNTPDNRVRTDYENNRNCHQHNPEPSQPGWAKFPPVTPIGGSWPEGQQNRDGHRFDRGEFRREPQQHMGPGRDQFSANSYPYHHKHPHPHPHPSHPHSAHPAHQGRQGHQNGPPFRGIPPTPMELRGRSDHPYPHPPHLRGPQPHHIRGGYHHHHNLQPSPVGMHMKPHRDMPPLENHLQQQARRRHPVQIRLGPGWRGPVPQPTPHLQHHNHAAHVPTPPQAVSVPQLNHPMELSGAGQHSKKKCVSLKAPLPSKFQGDIDSMKSAMVPEFTALVNFPSHMTGKSSSVEGMRCCVMCGRACPAPNSKNKKTDVLSSGDNKASKGKLKYRGNHEFSDGRSSGICPIIPTQNKGLCTSCDVNVWVVNSSGLQIKWCKGCKNFRPWAAFGDKGLATKCVRCRERQREKYAMQKEEKEKAKIRQKLKKESSGQQKSSQSPRVESEVISSVSIVTSV